MKKKKIVRSVTIRQKPISNGRFSLYLDYYPPIPNPETGKLVRREYLGLHLFNRPRNEADKLHNQQTKELAKNICAQRQIAIQNEHYGFRPTEKDNTLLVDYYKALIAKRSGSNSENWKSSLYFLEQYFDEGTKLSSLTVTTCTGFRDYLLTAPRKRKARDRQKALPITRNSAHSYFSKFKAMLKQAYKDGLLTRDLDIQVAGIKMQETHREFLTLEELQTLASTACGIPEMRQAALFSALTGLRFSDILKLTWGEVHHSKADGYYLQFRQQKTQATEVLPIPEKAIQLLGERGTPTARVLPELKYLGFYSRYLKLWVQKAGISKSISFHSFRHTFATLQLSLGTDLYTVSKLLGHRELKTTQIYAKVIDKKKQEAAGKINIEL